MSGINTFGYDMVYAMRFTEANQQFQAAFDAANQHKDTIGRALADKLGNGFQMASSGHTNLLAVVTDKGSNYTQTPGVRIVSPETGLPSNTIARPLMRLQRLEVVEPANYPTPPLVTFVLPAGETVTKQATVTLRYDQVGKVDVTAPGDDYDAAPTVRLEGGGGSGATATAIVENKKIKEIKVTNPGTGYSSAPSVVIEEVAFATPAAATAVLGLSLVVEDEGSGYTAVPEVRLNDEAGSVRVFMQVEDIAFARKDAALSHDYFSLPPALHISAATGAGSGAMAFTLLAVQDANALTPPAAEQTKPASVAYLSTMLQEAALTWLAQLDELYALGIGFKNNVPLQTELKNRLRAASEEYVEGNNFKKEDATLHDYIERMAGVMFAYFLEKCPLYSFEHELSILQKARKDASSAYATEAQFILASYKLSKTEDGIKFFLEEEQRKAGFRVQKALRAVDATLVFAYEQDPGTASAPNPKYFVPLSQPLALTSLGRQQLIATVREVVGALTPETQSAQLVALGRQFKSTTERFQKINLQLGAWQLLTGGDSTFMHLKIPIRGGLIYLGEEATEIKPVHQLYIRLKLQLAWLQRANTTTLTLQTAKSEDGIQVLGVEAEDGAPENKELTEELREILLWCVKNTLNKHKYKPGEAYHLLTPVDYSFTYNHSLATLNIYEAIADEENAFAWMYPTSVSYAVKDAYPYDKGSGQSILGICCMSEGRENKNPPDVDINAVPDGAETAILLSKEMVLNKFVLPQFLKLFKHGTEEARIEHFLPLVDGEPVRSATTGYAHKLIYTNSVDLTTEALAIGPRKEDGNQAGPDAAATPDKGTVRAGGAQLRMEEDVIRLSLVDVEYQYTMPGESQPIPMKVTNELGFLFDLKEEKGVKSLHMRPYNISYSYRPTYKAPENSWTSVLASVGIEFLAIMATNLVFGIGASLADVLLNRKSLPKKDAITQEDLQKGIDDSNQVNSSQLDLLPHDNEGVKAGDALPELKKVLESGAADERIVIKQGRDQPKQDIKVFDLEVGEVEAEASIKLKDKKGLHSDIQLVDIKSKDAANPLPEAQKQQVERLIGVKGKTAAAALMKTTALKPDTELVRPASSDSQPVDIQRDATNKTWGSFLSKRMRNVKKEHLTVVGVASLVGAAIGGGFVVFLSAKAEKKYEEYKNNVDRNMDSSSGNGVNSLTKALINKIKWPGFTGKSLELSHFYLDGSLVVGLNPTSKRRLLEGYASPYNPNVPLAHFDPATESIGVSNTGDSPLKLVFVQNKEAYQAHMGWELGNAVAVAAHTQQTIPVSAFHLESFDEALLAVQAEENETTFTLALL